MRGASPCRGISAIRVPSSGSQANGGPPAIVRSIEPVSGKTGSTIQCSVTAKSWIMLANGSSTSSVRRTAPSAPIVATCAQGEKRPRVE